MKAQKRSSTNELDSLQKKYRELSQKEKDLRVLHDFAIDLLHQETLDDVVWAIARNAIAKLGFVDCVIYLMDEEGNNMIQVAAHGPKNPQKMDILNPIIIPVGEGIVGTVAKTKKAEIIGDTSNDNRYILDDDFRYSEISVPILDGKSNSVIGIIDSEHPEKNFFTNQHKELLQTIAAMSSTKIQHAKAIEQLKAYKMGLEQQVAEKTKALKNKVEQLKKTNQDLETFVYAASHDLAEPLRTISSFLQLIVKREKSLSPSSNEFIDYVINGTHRMKKLLNGLLDYSKANQKLEYFSTLSPKSLIETVQSNLSELIQKKKAAIIIHPMSPFEGNEVAMLQLFQNLIGNAVKFHHKDRDPIVQIFQIEKEFGYLFKVQDNGIGMEEDFYEKAFKLFGRLHSFNEYQGSGIGLAICKTIVENHGGKIWIESKKDEGTTVYFTLNK